MADVTSIVVLLEASRQCEINDESTRIPERRAHKAWFRRFIGTGARNYISVETVSSRGNLL